MAAEEEDLEAIAWPGFVDILSSVIIMFVFFMLVIASILYFHMIIYVSKIKSDQVAEQVQSEFEFLFKQEQTEFAESVEQSVEVNETQRTLTVFFGADAISVLPKTLERIQSELSAYNPDDYNIIITAPRSKRATDITQRKISIARMFNVRNTVLEAGFPPESAIPRLQEYVEINGSTDWAIIKVIPK